MDVVIDTQQQYSYHNCLPIYGLEEENNKNTDQHAIDMLHESMRQMISPQDLDQSHGLCGNKPIVAWMCYNTRGIIYINKKKNSV